MLQEIATLPNRIMSNRMTERSFSREAVLVIVLGVLGAAGWGYAGSQALSAVSGGVATLRFEFIGAALRPFVALIFLWIGYTLIGHVLASVYGGRGHVSRLFRASAWALVPVGIWMTIRSIVIAVLFFGVDFPAEPEGLSAGDKFETIEALGLETPIYTLVLLVGIAFVVWSGYLLADAIAQAKNIDTDDARRIAAIPTAVAALYLLWIAINHAGIL